MKEKSLFELFSAKGGEKFPCTECGGDATLAYTPNTIKKGKNKGKEIAGWDGKILPGERLCLPCGRKRGIKFF